MRTQFPSKQTTRARIRDLLVGQRVRSADLIARIGAMVTADALSTIDAATFGLFNDANGTDVASITATDKTLTSPDNPWTAADVGKTIDVAGAGAAGAVLRTVIASFTTAGSIELRDAATTTVAASVGSAGGLAVWGYPPVLTLKSETLRDIAGSSLHSVSPGVPGGAGRQVGDKLADILNVADFGAVGDWNGSTGTDNSVALQAAIDAAEGRALDFPAGQYYHSQTLIIKNHSRYFGQGWGSALIYGGTGDAVRLDNGINASVGAHVIMRDMAVKSINVASTGGTFVDIGSTFLYLENCWFYGGKYGVIFDQTEISSIKDCRVEMFTYGGIWLCNGDDHSVGALGGYTNCIQVERCQINTASVAAGIIDDGGTAHTIEKCNFNACQNHIVAADVNNLLIKGCEFEAATGAMIRLRGVTYTGGDAVGACGTVRLEGNYIAPTVGQDSVTITTVNSLSVVDNRFSTSAATITGCASANAIFAEGNLDSNVGTIFDGLAAHHWEHAAAKQTIAVKNDYDVTGKVTASGLVGGSNIPAPVSFTTTVAVSTGISINGGTGGRNILALLSCQNGAANATASALYLIRCGYDANNFTATKISGDDGGAGAGASTFAFTQVGGVLYVANTVSGNGRCAFLANV